MSGYTLVDATGLDTSKASQTVSGLYTKLTAAIEADKLMIFTNVGIVTPMAGYASIESTGSPITIALPAFTATVASDDTVTTVN